MLKLSSTKARRTSPRASYTVPGCRSIFLVAVCSAERQVQLRGLRSSRSSLPLSTSSVLVWRDVGDQEFKQRSKHVSV